MNICQNLTFESLLSKVSLLSNVSKHYFEFVQFWLFSQKNQPTLDWKFRNGWTKKFAKVAKKNKCFTFLSWKKMNGSCLISQVRSCMLPYASQIAEKAFFQIPYLEHCFMIANLVRLKLVVRKILETSQYNTPVWVLYY